ncbi:ABC transporter-like protein [Perkinsela sp. CCAP 1560/4]|nr:ABC transporter-like protein [Perkinsela sp. CCAP 1560/4]|eukprot:KNH04735.1 ABC transporter-like protein [Perkinsela sp. CCAP 1560/4]
MNPADAAKLSPLCFSLSKLLQYTTYHGGRVLRFISDCFLRHQSELYSSNCIVVLCLFTSGGLFLSALKLLVSISKKGREEDVWKAYALHELCGRNREIDQDSVHKINLEQIERLYNLLDLARELEIDPCNREYREVCYVLANSILPGKVGDFPEESFLKNINRNRPLRKLRILTEHFFFYWAKEEDESEDWHTLASLCNYPEILYAVKEEFRFKLEKSMYIASARQSFHFFEYFAFHSCTKALVYALVLHLSAISALSQSSVGMVSQKKANLWLFSFLYRAFSEKNNDFTGAVRNLGKALKVTNIQSLCSMVVNFLFKNIRQRLLERVSSSHRKHQARKFHQTLKGVSAEYLDAHSIDDIEGLYYYIHDLEGAEIQMQLLLTRIWDGICHLWSLQYKLNCTLPVILTSWGASYVIDNLFEGLSSSFWRLSGIKLRNLELEISRTKDIFGSYNTHQEEDSEILFHKPLYVAVISHLKTFRMMGLDKALLDQLENTNTIVGKKESLFSTVGEIIAESCERTGNKYTSHNAVSMIVKNLLDLIKEQAVGFGGKFLDLANLTAQMIVFLALAAPSIVIGEETTYFLQCLESFESYQTSRGNIAQWKNIIELLETNAERASELNAFFSEENALEPNPPLFVAEKPNLIGETDDGFIYFRDVCFKHKDDRAPILRSLSLRIPLGCFCVIRGPNGCGKSTLLSILAQLYTLQHGDIKVVLHKQRSAFPQGAPEKRWRNLASFLPQAHALLPCSLADNVFCSRSNISEEKLKEVCEATRLLRDVDSLACGWQTLIGCGTGKTELSLGQAQKVMLARFLLNDSLIWVLDEPTNFLDAETKASLIAYFRKFLASEQNTECRGNDNTDLALIIPRSIICVSHDDTFISHADLCIDFPCN